MFTKKLFTMYYLKPATNTKLQDTSLTLISIIENVDWSLQRNIRIRLRKIGQRYYFVTKCQSNCLWKERPQIISGERQMKNFILIVSTIKSDYWKLSYCFGLFSWKAGWNQMSFSILKREKRLIQRYMIIKYC